MSEGKAKKRVLVTGASGLIGKETLAPLKDAGFDVYAVSRQKQSSDANWLKNEVGYTPQYSIEDALDKIITEFCQI